MFLTPGGNCVPDPDLDNRAVRFDDLNPKGPGIFLFENRFRGFSYMAVWDEVGTFVDNRTGIM